MVRVLYVASSLTTVFVVNIFKLKTPKVFEWVVAFDFIVILTVIVKH